VLVTDFSAGDPSPTNAMYNAWLRAARRGRLASVAGGMELSGGGLSMSRSPRFWALLSGAGPAYDFAEATQSTDGTFAALSGGRTDDGGSQPAYDLNAATGLAGTYQRLAFSAANDWRFQEIKYVAGGGGGGTACGQTITLTDCDGSPISGATIALPSWTGGAFTPITIGTTDESGSYTFTVGTFEFLIIYDGCTGFGYTNGFQTYYCDGANSAAYCYWHAQYTVTSADPASTITGTLGGPPCGTWTGGNTTGTATFTVCSIGLCGPDFPPTDCMATFTATPPLGATCWHDGSGYLSYCMTVPVACGDQTLAIPQFQFAGSFVHAPDYCEDEGCTVFGPAGRGLLPLAVQVRLTTIPNPYSPFGACPLFADDEGVWITLNLATVSSPVCGATTYYYDSGCRAGMGNFLAYGSFMPGAAPSAPVNCPGLGSPNHAFFNSTQVLLGVPPFGTTGFGYGGSYVRFGADGCSSRARCQDGHLADLSYNADDGTVCGNVATPFINGYFPCYPDDFESVENGQDSENFTLEVRDVP
jgi:hypothetical protein